MKCAEKMQKLRNDEKTGKILAKLFAIVLN